MRCYRRRRGVFDCRRGLTLIELMVTVLILGIGLTGTASMFIVGYRTQLHGHLASVAADVASKKLECVKAAGYNGLNPTLFPPTFEVPGLPSGAGTLVYTPYPVSDSTNQYVVQATITWEGGPGVAGRVVLWTVVSNHG